MTRLHDRIRAALDARPDLTQKGLAERMGLNPAAVNRMLYGRRNIMAEEIPLIEDFLGLRLSLAPTAEKAAAQESLPPLPFLPPVPVFALDGKSAVPGTEPLDWAPRAPQLAGIRDAFAVYVMTAEMEPRYFKGEIAYVHPTKPAEAGRDCLVVPVEGGAFLARLVSETGSKMRVAQYNPEKERDVLKKDIRAVYAVAGRG